MRGDNRCKEGKEAMSIRTMPITLSMKDTMERIRYENGYITASHAFASLFIWKKEMGLSVYLEEDLFAVKCRLRGENAWFFPCGGKAAVRDFICRCLGGEGLLFCYMRRKDAEFLEQEFPGRFCIREREADHEYIYDRKEQQELKGKEFLAARKYIHRLTAAHVLEWEPVCSGNLADAVALVSGWKERAEGIGGLRDTAASVAMLAYWEELDGAGILVRIDGTPGAVMAGFPIGKSMFDISLGKQSCYLTGMAEYARNALCSFLPEKYSLVNGEEDLGIGGLRQMKQRMRPVGLLQMYEGRADAVGRQA